MCKIKTKELDQERRELSLTTARLQAIYMIAYNVEKKNATGKVS